MARRNQVTGSAISAMGLCVVSTFAAPAERFPEVPASRVAGRPAFAVRGYHQHIFPDRHPMEIFEQRMETLAGLGYNTVFFGMGSPSMSTIHITANGEIEPRGCGRAAMQRLVAKAIGCGLEPIFEMKFIGKQIPLLGDWLAQYPGLVIDPKNRATVLDATYRMPDGRSAYDATALRLVRWLLDLYPDTHPPKFFHFGIDEFDADDMAALGRKLDMTPPQAFAHCLNLGTDMVLERGITPIIWGDLLLSPELAGKNHGISLPGFKPDPRHAVKPGGAYHADYKSGKVSLHTMVNHLRDTDKIIVADWHYSPSTIGDFPSVDHFQALGFKDVWGCPWYSPVNMRQFSRYAALRNCGGMVATAWHVAYQPSQALWLRFILESSSAYFRRPGLEPPEVVPAQYTLRGANGRSLGSERGTGLVTRDDLTLTFRAPVPEPLTPANPALLLTPPAGGMAALTVPLTFDPEQRSVNATFDLPEDTPDGQVLQIGYGYADASSGFFLRKHNAQGLLITDTKPAIPDAGKGVLLYADFRELADPRLGRTLWLGGECSTPLGVARPRKPGREPRAEGVDAAWFDRLWVLTSDYLDHALAEPFCIEIVAKMTNDVAGDDFNALFTKGSYNTGFRVLVRRDGKLLFQLARLKDGNPLWIYSADRLPQDRWVKISLTYTPPRDDAPGEATIAFNGKLQARESVTIGMEASSAVIGIGCEFTNPMQGPTGKRRPNFPGMIRSVTVRRFPADASAGPPR